MTSDCRLPPATFQLRSLKLWSSVTHFVAQKRRAEGAHALLCWQVVVYVCPPPTARSTSRPLQWEGQCVCRIVWVRRGTITINTRPSRGRRGRISDRRRINLNLIMRLLWSKVLHCVWVLSEVCIATEQCYFCWAGIITKHWWMMQMFCH